MTVWIATLIAIFVWWFATGALLWIVKTADRFGNRAGFWVTFWALPLLGVGVYGVALSQTLAGVTGVYAGFFAALAIWGWIELAFLTGVITGPNTKPLEKGLSETDRFVSALNTLLFHEALLVICLIGLGLALFDAQNTVAFWVFAVLFGARVSAKLNLFLGVARTHSEFLPKALSHLATYFRDAPINRFYPFSITLLLAASLYWSVQLTGAQTQADQIAYALLAVLTALALLEHLVMVLPIPDERLWRWMLPAPALKEQQKGESRGL